MNETQILSVSAASKEQDNRLKANLDSEIADLNITIDTLSVNKIVEGDSGVVVNDEGTGTITISADGSTIATFKDGKVGIGLDPDYPLDVAGPVFLGNTASSGGLHISYSDSDNRENILFLKGSTWKNAIQIASVEDDLQVELVTDAYLGMGYLSAQSLKLVGGGANINEFSIDGTLGGNSDNAVPTEKAVKTYVDANAGGGGGGFSNKIIEGDSGVTVNDEGTGSINISADGDHLAQFKEKEIRLIPGADSNDRIYMGTPADKTGGYFEVGPSAALSPSGIAPLQYNGYFYATKVYNAVWG